jgi:hypothetical protein
VNSTHAAGNYQQRSRRKLAVSTHSSTTTEGRAPSDMAPPSKNDRHHASVFATTK